MICKVPAWLLTTILLGASTLSASNTDDSLFVSAMGARSQAMGGTGVASTYDLSPAFNNPALLALASPWNTAFSFRHPSSRVRGISLYTNGKCRRKVYRWGMGVDAIWAKHSRWPVLRRARSTNMRVQATMAVARRVYDELVVGVAFKPAGWQLYGEKHFSFEADLGLAYPTRWREIDIVAGAVVRDLLGADVTRLDHDTALDVSALLGVAGHYVTKDSLWELSMGIDLEAIERDFVADPQGRFRIGGEAAWHRFAGYRLAGRLGHNGEHVTFGLGIDWRFLKFDWAKTWTRWETGQNVTLSIDPRGAMDYLSELFGQTAPAIHWRDSIFVYRREQFTQYDSSAEVTFDAALSDTARFDESRILYHNARVFADDADQMARADSGVARSEEILDRWEFVADSLLRETALGDLLQAKRSFTDSHHRELLSRADTCFRHRDYVCALELIDMVLAQDSAHAEALSLKSDVEQGQASGIGSSSVLADTTSLDDIKADSAIYALWEQGLAFNSNQEYQKAIEAFNKVLDKYPNSPAVIEERRQALLRLQ